MFIYYLNKKKKNLSHYNTNGAYKLKELKLNNGRIKRYN